MTTCKRINIGARAAILAVVSLAPKPCFAQTDEIQVYDATVTERREFNLTWHNNFTPAGVTTPAFPGALVSDKSINGVAEWAYGVTDWFEAGLYMPVYSIGKRNTNDGARAMFDGFKMRLLFVAPHANDRTFFYGANLEFSVNASHWDPARFTSEVRPILGWHLHSVDIIVNPIVDTAYDGLANLVVAPAVRLAYAWTDRWVTAVEEYDDFGPLHHFSPSSKQSHQLYGVLNHHAASLDVEAGVGFGLTDGSDRLTLKLLLSRNLGK